MLCLLGSLLITVPLFALVDPSVIIKVEIDQQEITIGDPVVYTVVIEREPGVELDIPVLKKTFGSFRIKRLLAKKQKRKKGRVINRYKYLMTTFNTGTQIIPSFKVFVRDEEGRKTEVKSEGLIIKVKSVLPAGEDPKDIRGLKPLILKKNIMTTVLLILMVLGAGALVYFLARKIKFKKKAPPPAEVAVQTAEAIALQRLKELKHSELLKKGRAKQYYYILSEIIRQYLENRYQMPVKERTTNEIMTTLSSVKEAQKYASYFGEFLNYCDMVKFSPYLPTELAAEEIIKRAREIIRLTKPKVEEKIA